MKMLLIGVCALALTACATGGAGVRHVELVPEPDFALTLTAGVAEGAERLGALPDIRIGAADPDAPLLNVSVRVITLSAAGAAQLLGDHGYLAAHSLTHAQADELVRAANELPDTQVRGMPRLSVHEGQTGGITIISEREYVSGYTVRVRENEREVEAVTSRYLDGFRLDVTGRRVGERLHLELDLLVHDVRRTDETSVEVLGETIGLETPLKVAQHIRGRGHVSRDRVLVLSGQGAGGVVLALVATE
jgi:hypothetical protein